MSAPTKGIYITRVRAEMLHRLTFAEVELDAGGNLIRVTGDNGSGKSSFLRIIREVMGGAGEVLPVAVNEESEDGTGFGLVELSNGYTITRTFSEAAPKGRLAVVGPDGGKHGQAKLDGWMGENHDFDLLAYYGLKPERQAEILIGLSKDPGLGKKLDRSRQRYAELKAERTPHISEQQRCWRTEEPEGERPEPVDVSGEMARLGELQAAEVERGAMARELHSAEAALRNNGDRQLDQSTLITLLVKQLADAEADLVNLQAFRLGLEEFSGDAAEALSRSPSVRDAIQAVQERVSQADAVNTSLEPWKEYDRAQASLKEATEEVDGISAQMEALRETDRKLVSEAGIPVEGVTLSPGGEPLLNGRPLEVASGGERIRMAMDVAVAADPDLRVILIDEGNNLGLKMMREVADEAKARGFQTFVCRLEGEGDVQVKDGVALSSATA